MGEIEWNSEHIIKMQSFRTSKTSNAAARSLSCTILLLFFKQLTKQATPVETFGTPFAPTSQSTDRQAIRQTCKVQHQQYGQADDAASGSLTMVR